jgi:hypothetical protein
MALLRTILTFVVALSLAALPARVGAIGSLGGSEMASSSMPECESLDGASCEPAQAAGMHVAAADHMPMSGGCDHPGDHGAATPGACSTYCNNVSAIPATSFPAVDIAVIESVTPAVAMPLYGIGLPPEPHPPKLA